MPHTGSNAFVSSSVIAIPVSYVAHRLLNRQRTGITRADGDVYYSPTFVRTILVAQQSHVISQSKCYIKTVERLRHSAAGGFDVCLLARPAAKKRGHTIVLRQLTQTANFVRREKSSRNVIAREVSANVFHVNSDLASFRHCIQGDAMRMRHVEPQRTLAKLISQRRLTPRPVRK